LRLLRDNRVVSGKTGCETEVGMVEYIKVSDYIKITSKNRSSVYRDIKKEKLKTTKIDGVLHVIVEDETETGPNGETDETGFETNNRTAETPYQDAEIIEENRKPGYEIEAFRASLATLEDFAYRIEAAKDETISRQDETIQRLNKQIDSLNETLSLVSKDNTTLRNSVAIRDSEVALRDKRIEELETKIKQYETALEQVQKEYEKEQQKNQQISLNGQPGSINTFRDLLKVYQKL